MSRRERIAQERADAARQTGNGAGDSGTAAASGAASAPASGTTPTGPRPVIKSASRHSEHSYGTPTGASAQAYAASAPQTEPMPVANRHGDFDTVVFGDEPPRNRKAHKPKPEREPLGPVRGTIRAFDELCITAGLILILFVVWQLWWTDIEANEDNRNLANELTTQWRDNPRNELPDDPDTPYVSDPADINSAFGIMYIPRFGEDYYRTIAEGVSLEPVLNRMGLGRYPNAAMPGEVGNFAMAGHRVTYGKPLKPHRRDPPRRRGDRADSRRLLHLHLRQLRHRAARPDRSARPRTGHTGLQGQGPGHDTHGLQPDVLGPGALHRLLRAHRLAACQRGPAGLHQGLLGV